MKQALKISALALAAMLAACGGGGGGGSSGGALPIIPVATPAAPVAPAAPAMPARAECTVQFEGDSILGGWYSGTQRHSPTPAADVVRMRPAWSITDLSASGMSAGRRAPVFINESVAARVVVIEYGMNDANESADYETPLRTILQRVKALGKTAIITGLSHTKAGHPIPRDAYDAIARRVASEEGVIFADWDAVPATDDDMADQLHPNQAYSTRLAEQLVRALDIAAPECKP